MFNQNCVTAFYANVGIGKPNIRIILN